MINAISNTINLPVVWQYVGPLIGVGFGYLISDKVWDRQKQWEMKRDVVDEAVRTLGELELSLMDLHTYYSMRIPDSEDSKARVLVKRSEARDHYDLCCQKYYRVMFSVDLTIGEILANRLSGYFQHTGRIALNILNGDTASLAKPETMQSLANETREIIRIARNVLNIKNTG